MRTALPGHPRGGLHRDDNRRDEDHGYCIRLPDTTTLLGRASNPPIAITTLVISLRKLIPPK